MGPKLELALWVWVVMGVMSIRGTFWVECFNPLQLRELIVKLADGE